MSIPRGAKMADLVNYRLRVVTLDGRQLTGQMLAFDKFMNLVLADTQEFRITKKTLKTVNPVEEARALGLVILRGESIISVSVEGGPPADAQNQRVNTMPAGPGTARTINRATAASSGLSGPVRHTGGATASGQQRPSGFQPPPGFR